MKRILAALAAVIAFAAWAEIQPLTPVYQGTKTISCTGTTSATALPTTIAQQRANLEIQNAGSVTVFVEVGASTIEAAAASGYPVLAGQSKVITVAPSITHIACIATSGTQTVYVTTGSGA